MELGKLNIVVVNDFGNVNGGAAKVAIDSVVGLSKTGHNIYYMCGSGMLDPKLSNSSINVTNLNQGEIKDSKNILKGLIRGLWNRKAHYAMNDLLKNLNKHNTIIHVHGWTKSLTVSTISAALKSGFKVVITLHDFFVYCPNGGFYNFPGKYICNKTPLSLGCLTSNCDSRNYFYKIYRVFRSTIERITFNRYLKEVYFIALSKLSYDILKPYVSKFKATEFIENPIDAIKGPKVDIMKNHYFVYIGRLSYEKGCEYFCNAISKMNGVTAIVIGEGDEMTDLQMRYPNISFLGWQSKADINKILFTARCLVFPSVWYETYGLVVQEAAALGIPAIVSDCTAACEFITHGQNGLIFKAEDVNDLQQQIKKVSLDNEFVRELGNSAYNFFWDKDHSITRHVNSLISYYTNVLRNE